MSEELQMSKDNLAMLLTAPPTQLDESMVKKLKVLLDDEPDRDQLRLGLKDILDLCVYSALASGFVMKILNHEWEQVGGKPGDPVSEEVQSICQPA